MSKTMHPVEPEELMAYLDGEMKPDPAAAVAAHLSECKQCQAASADLAAVHGQMLSWPVEAPPASLAATIEKELAGGKRPAAAMRRMDSLLRWRIWAYAGGAAAFILLALVIVTPNLLRSRGPAYFSRPVDLAADKFAVSPPAARAPENAVSQPNGPMVIRTASLMLVTKEFDKVRAQLEQTVARHHGYVANLTTGRAGDGQSLTATLRMPASELDVALAELKKLGRVEKESQSGSEVTAQYVDLVARLSNARVTEQRLIQVLRERTGRVADILEVEREIARVREQIERMEAERKSLENQVAFGTVQVAITEEYRAELQMAPPSTATRLWNEFVEGWRGLADTALDLTGGILRYGPTVVFWLLILFLPARLVWRRIRAAKAG